ncbi:MAG: ribonuclease Z [Porphyromonas sp.]|nr:ribonuclease Z [Porphyromonas sp.]
MNNKKVPNLGDGLHVQVLGCGSARPSHSHHPSAQIVRLRNKSFLIDCGEGTQMRMLEYGASFTSLHRIFISHLHGDHVFGLPGLISTMALYGLEHPIHIYGPKGIIDFVLILNKLCGLNEEESERLIAHELTPSGLEPIYEDSSITVSAFSLLHRVPTVGYRFDERPKSRALRRDMVDYHGVPIAFFNLIKQGADFVKEDGTVIPNHLLTSPPPQTGSYAYCSDTAYSKKIVPYIEGVSLLYHESTFDESLAQRAKETMHSTAKQAGKIAMLAGVDELLIGHYSARYGSASQIEVLRSEAAEIFPNTRAAIEGHYYRATPK